MRLSPYLKSAALCSAFTVHASYASMFPEIGRNTDFNSAISIRTETVGDQVDYSPNLDEGGFATPEKRSRYQSAGLEYTYQKTSSSLISVLLSQQQLSSLRDSYDISQLEANALLRISPQSARYSFDLAFGAQFNYSDQLLKNSYTTHEGNLITRSTIDNPQDQSLSLNVITGLNLGRGFSIKAVTGGGITRSDHDTLSGIGNSSNGCRYAFSTDGTQGSLDQIGPCGEIVSYQQTFANEQGVEDRLGFRASRDIAYLARFVQTGAELGWSNQRFSTSLGYSYRRYFRGALDQRIDAAGGTPVRVSQLLNATASYTHNSRMSLSLAATYHSAPFLDDIPLLYTAFTSDRYNNADALSVRLGVSWFFGRRL